MRQCLDHWVLFKAPTATHDGEDDDDVSLGRASEQGKDKIDSNVAESETPNANVTETQPAALSSPAIIFVVLKIVFKKSIFINQIKISHNNFLRTLYLLCLM